MGTIHIKSKRASAPRAIAHAREPGRHSRGRWAAGKGATGLGVRGPPGRTAANANAALADLSRCWCTAPPPAGRRINQPAIPTSAFAIRAERTLDDGSTFQFSLSQPLRVEGGRARLSVPVGRIVEGRVVRQRVRADLAPSGRQLDLGMQWCCRSTEIVELRLGAVRTRHPGHDASWDSWITRPAGWRADSRAVPQVARNGMSGASAEFRIPSSASTYLN